MAWISHWLAGWPDTARLGLPTVTGANQLLIEWENTPGTDPGTLRIRVFNGETEVLNESRLAGARQTETFVLTRPPGTDDAAWQVELIREGEAGVTVTNVSLEAADAPAPISGADSGTALDSRFVTINLNTLDAAALTESRVATVDLARADTAALTESSFVGVGFPVVDTGSAADSAQVTPLVSQSDSATLTESAQVTVNLSTSDAAVATDSIAVTQS